MNTPVNDSGELPNQTGIKPGRRKLPWILLLIFITSLTLGMAGFIAATEGGLQWAFSILARNIPGELRADHIEGRLIGPLSIRGLSYTTAGKNITITIDKLDADIRPLALLYERVHISRLDISGVSYTQSRSQEPLIALPDLQLPLGITLDQASLTNITVILPDLKQSYPIERITLTGKTLRGRLHIDALNLVSHSFQAHAYGTLTPQNIYPLNLNINWSALPQGYPAITGQTTLTGSLARQLNIAQSINAPLRATLQGTVRNMLTALQWQANLTLEKTNLRRLAAHWPNIDMGGKIHIVMQGNNQGGQNPIIIDGTLQVTHQKHTLNTTARANFSDNKWHIEQASLTLPGNPARLMLKGELGTGLIPAHWQLTGRWHDLAWPPSKTPQAAAAQGAVIASKEGSFTLTGKPDAYHFTMDASISGATFPSGHWVAAGEGDRKGLVINEIQADILEGRIAGQGKLNWQQPHLAPGQHGTSAVQGSTSVARGTTPGATSIPGDRQLSWSADMTGNDLNPGQYWPAWPGQLGLRARISSAAQPSGITLDISDLHGQLRNIPVRGNASLTIDQDTYALSQLVLASESSQLSASGTLNETWNMQWSVDIKNLHEILPDASLKHSGTLKGHGSLTGPRALPRISAAAQGRSLMINAYHADELRLTLDVDTQNQLPSQLDLSVNGMMIGNQSIDSLVMKGRGLAQNHAVDATLKTSGKTLALRAEGALGEGIAALGGTQTTTLWTGRLTQADVTSQTLGYWPLTTPGILTITTDHAQLGPWCWAQQDAQLCFDATRTAHAGWQGNARSTHLPITWLQPFIPGKTIVAGTFDAAATVYSSPAGMITGTARFTPSPGVVVHPLADDQNLILAYTQGLIETTLDADALNTRATLTLTDRGTLDGALLLSRSALPTFLNNSTAVAQVLPPGAAPIKGQLNAEIHDLGLLPDFFPEIEDTQGRINIALNVEGTPDQPRFSGYAKLEHGTALVPRLGLKLRDIQARITGTHENQLSLAAQARSGNGVLHARGTLRPGNKQRWGADLTVQGEHFEAIHTPGIKATVSPNLTVKIASNTVDVNGNLIIPDANIELRDLTATVRPSSDAIVIRTSKDTDDQDTSQPAISNKRWAISSVIGLKLGDNVTFKGIGLSGRFTGDLALIDTPQQITTAYGEIRIEDGGEYRAVNQKLEVKKGGRLVFAGGPINNPGIDARATRQVNSNIRVGFNVRGTLQSPQLLVYSEPPMPETDALAYLLLGHPISQATRAEGGQMVAAASSFGLAGGEFLMKKIGNAFGIEDIRIEAGAVASTRGTSATTQQATVVLGKYLSPKLYITYGVGTVDRINTLRLRYQISRRWTVEAESGLHQGTDLLYTIDRK